MPRFVILTHDHPFPHWDLMLQHGEVLWTWRLLDEPNMGRICRAERLADHRLSYLDYEGPVSGDRGSVYRVAAGEYAVVEQDDRGLRANLHGSMGEITLVIQQSTTVISVAFVASSSV